MTDDTSTDSNGATDSNAPTYSTCKEIFPWERDFDLNQLAEEYAMAHSLDLETTKQKFAECQDRVARDMEPGRWISSEIAKLADEQ
jgi:hypothetical protein